MTISYPGSTGPFPARTPEPHAEVTAHVALCDGTVFPILSGFDGAVIAAALYEANALAADRLVERIAKRVTEMQAAAASAVKQVDADGYEVITQYIVGRSEPLFLRGKKADFARNFGSLHAESKARFE